MVVISWKSWGGLLLLLLLTPCLAASLYFTIPETYHTVIFPLERSFIFSIRFQNDRQEDIMIELTPEEVDNEDWLVILPTGRLLLSPGEELEIIVTFEPTFLHDNPNGELRYNFSFKINDVPYTVQLEVKYSSLDLASVPSEKLRIEVLDKETQQPVPGAEVLLTIPTGLFDIRNVTGSDGVLELHVPSSSYIQSLYEEYNATVSFKGYFIEVYKPGYKAYYDYGVETGGVVRVFLEPQRKYFEYEKIGEVQTEYTVWWIKAPSDCSYIVTSPGAHGNIEHPDETAIYIIDINGTVISRYPIMASDYNAPDICWGLDVSPDGSFIAAGCYNGYVYLFDRNGNLVNTYNAGGMVRWVKFSPDGKYLAFGPTNNGADYVGLFSVPDLTVLWEGFVGDWSRTVAFSNDGNLIAVGSSNGVLSLFDINGNKLWQASNGGLVPFVIGFDGKGERIVIGGKGRTLIVYDKSGEVLWKKYLDHVIIAGGISDDGAVAVGTVGGIVYYFNPDGSLSFRRIQGGIEHNGLYLTRNGRYVLLGGMNPTLLDANGTILWQLHPGEKATITAPQEELDAVNTVFLSEDANIMVLGYNNGKIEFWKKNVEIIEEQKPIEQKAPQTSPNGKQQSLQLIRIGITVASTIAIL